MRTTGLHHLAIQGRDLVALERFYVGVLGLEVIARHGERSVWLALGGAGGAGGGGILMLERADPDLGTGATERRAGFTLLALQIARADRAAWRARIAAAGVAVMSETQYTLYLCDPEGNRLGLSHYPEAQ